MLSLSNVFKQEVLTETIVDLMFDSLQAHIINNDIEQAKKDIEDFADKLQIEVRHKINPPVNNIPDTYGRTKSIGEITRITITRTKNVDINSVNYFLVMVHELAHAIFAKCFSIDIDEQTYYRLTTSDKVRASNLNYYNMSIDNSLQYLQYIFDFREWSAMAFTVAYGAYKFDNLEEIIKNNREISETFIRDTKNKINIERLKNIVERQGEFLSILFNVQLAMYFLRDKSSEYIKYKTKVAKFIKLVLKYYKRLRKLIEYAKNNKST